MVTMPGITVKLGMAAPSAALTDLLGAKTVPP